jgi:hypothetical protein
MRPARLPGKAGRMDMKTFRRFAATTIVTSFSLAALMGIAALLGAAELGPTEGRVLATTVVLGSASICVLCYLTTAGTRWVAVGVVGGFATVLATSTALLLVWSDGAAESWKPFVIGVVAAVSLAQTCLLLVLAVARRGLEVVLGATVTAIALLGILVSGLVLGGLDISDVWQLLGIVAILDVLGTVVTTAMAKFGRAAQLRDSCAAQQFPSGARAILVPSVQVAQLDQLVGFTGRTPEDLVAEALDRYLSSSRS